MIRKLNNNDELFANEYRNQAAFFSDLKNSYEYLGYFNDDKLVSFVCYILLGDECEIHFIVTRDEYKKQGFATQLLEELIRVVDRTIYLEVNEHNKDALKLYFKAGFKEISRRDEYYLDGDGLVLKREG